MKKTMLNTIAIITLAISVGCKDNEPVVKENAFQQKANQLIQQLNQKTEPPEQENGYKATFKDLPSQWTDLIKQNMETHWQSINRRGMNYFAIGKAEGENQYSNRVNPDSKYYQAWVGAYVLSGKNKLFMSMENNEINNKMEEVIPQLIRLAELDQQTWLYATGDPNPLATTLPLSKVETVSKFGLNIPLFKAKMNSHSDLTYQSHELSGLLGLPTRNIWAARLDPHHDVTLSAYYLSFYDAEKKLLVVAYANSAGYINKLGISQDYENAIKEELISIIKSIELVKL